VDDVAILVDCHYPRCMGHFTGCVTKRRGSHFCRQRNESPLAPLLVMEGLRGLRKPPVSTYGMNFVYVPKRLIDKAPDSGSARYARV
jgi:hypothetical protein